MTLKHVVCQCICLNSSKGILIIDKRMCTLDYANSNTELLQSVFSMIMLNSSKSAYYQKKFSREPLSKSCELDPLPAVVLKGCLTSYYYEDHQSVLIDWCCARCSEGCYTTAHIERIWCWLLTIPKLSSYLELKSSIEACWKGSWHTTHRSRHGAPLRWDVSVCI